MRFGPLPVAEAEGAILAHSLQSGERRIRKGRILDQSDLAALRAAGMTAVTVARLDPGDVHEDVAADRIAACLTARGIVAKAMLTGRFNMLADADGILRVDRVAIEALNAVDEAITLATLPDHARVAAGQLVATVKIIPYGVAGALVDRASGVLTESPFALHPFRPGRAALILTQTPGMPDKLLNKGARVVEQRLTALSQDLVAVRTTLHETDAVALALSGEGADLILILGASATSDRADVIPAAIEAAGGRVARYGMPVDPGNLLVLGWLQQRPVVGLPGCARSPALNGIDWVLERLVAGLEITDADFAAMGVGGLLKEIPTRPQPRRAGGQTRP